MLNRQNRRPLVSIGVILILGSCLLFPPVLALDDPAQKLTAAVINEVIARNPGYAALDIQVNFRNADAIFEKLSKLEENQEINHRRGVVELKILAPPQSKLVGNVICPVEVKSAGTSQKIFLRARVNVFKELVVADKTIKRGKEIESGDLRLEKRDIALLPQRYYSELKNLVGNEAKTIIPKHSTIFDWMTKEKPLVRRGDHIVVLLKTSDLQLKIKGMMLSDGYLGKPVKVKPLLESENSKKILDGILVSKNVVEVGIK